MEEENGATRWIGCRKSPRTLGKFSIFFEGLPEKATGEAAASRNIAVERSLKQKEKKRSPVSGQSFGRRESHSRVIKSL